MANYINKSYLSSVIANGGLPIGSLLIREDGEDSKPVVLASQIGWGDCKYNNTKITSTENLLNLIDANIVDKAQYYSSSAILSDDVIGEKISSYMDNNGVIPAIDITDKGNSAGATSYTYVVTGFTIDENNSHKITPIYNTVTEYEHPSAEQMWDEYTPAE